MNERGIIFSGALIPAVLDGSKTQTRRTSGLYEINEAPDDWRYLGINDDGLHEFENISGRVLAVRCPYGGVGDLLYVREKLTAEMYASRSWDLSYAAGGAQVLSEIPADYVPPQNTIQEHRETGDSIPGGSFPWYTATVPSIFMLKRFTRQWLRLIAEPVPERVADISEEDAIEEGYPEGYASSAYYWFRHVWQCINEARGYGWTVNPWVWPLEWERTEHESA